MATELDRASKRLPDGYTALSSASVEDKKIRYGLSALALAVSLGIFFGAWWFAQQVGPEGVEVPWLWIIAPVTIWLTIALHEVTHAAVMWLAAGERPRIRARGIGVLYVELEDWYFPKWQYLVFLISPFVVWTAVPVTLMFFLPYETVLAFAIAGNVGASFMDILGSFEVATKRHAVVENQGTTSTIYVPEGSDAK